MEASRRGEMRKAMETMMRSAILMAGAALIGFAASPALAGGMLGSSGNMGGLLGGQQGGHKPPVMTPPHGGGHDGGGWKGGERSEGSKFYKSGSETQASKRSGSKYQESSFNLRDTTIGGVYANPQVDASKMTKSFAAGSESGGGGHKGDYKGGGHGGGQSEYVRSDASKKSFSASFPVAVESTTIGGFSSHKASGSTWDNRDYSHRESTVKKSNYARQSGGGGHGH